MKKVILVLVVAMSVMSCISTKSVASPEPMSSNVVTQDDKDTNFIKANEWMVEQFNNAESVIQFADKEAGIIKGKYLMKEGFYQPRSQYTAEVKTPPTYAVITLRVKDNKARIEIALTSTTYTEVTYGGKVITPSPESLKLRGNTLMGEFAAAMKGGSANNSW